MYYKLNKKNNTGFDDRIFEYADVVFIEYDHGKCPILNYVASVDEEKNEMEVEWMEIPYLPFGIEKVAKKQYEMSIK